MNGMEILNQSSFYWDTNDDIWKLLQEEFSLWEVEPSITETVNISNKNLSRKRKARTSSYRYYVPVHKLPRILKRDMRRDLASMFNNVLNSCDGMLLRQFLQQFFVTSCQYIRSARGSRMLLVQGRESVGNHIMEGLLEHPDNITVLEDVKIIRRPNEVGSKVVCKLRMKFTKLIHSYSVIPTSQAQFIHDTSELALQEEEHNRIFHYRGMHPAIISNHPSNFQSYCSLIHSTITENELSFWHSNTNWIVPDYLMRPDKKSCDDDDKVAQVSNTVCSDSESYVSIVQDVLERVRNKELYMIPCGYCNTHKSTMKPPSLELKDSMMKKLITETVSSDIPLQLTMLLDEQLHVHCLEVVPILVNGSNIS